MKPRRLHNPLQEREVFNNRFFVIVGLFFLLLLLILWRYFHLQVLEHETYKTQSDRNRIHVTSVAPKRGLIVDRNGRLLAENQPSFSLVLTKERVPDLDQTLATLRELLDLEEDEIERFTKRLVHYRPFEAVPLKFALGDEEQALLAVNKKQLPGVEVEAQLVRTYPYGELLAHLLGYVGRINDREQQKIDSVNYAATHHIGKIGLERYYEQELHGQVGNRLVETNARGRVQRVLEETDPVPGADLKLYLDIDVQKAAFEALGEERGAVVAIEIKTGGILAAVSTPGFDPNLFVTGISQKDYSALRDSPDLPLFNRMLQGQYPPGSTVKPVIGLAGLEYGTVTEHTVISDPGWYQLPNDDRRYRDWKREGHGNRIDLKQSIAQSCDVYFYDLAYRLGIDNIHEFSTKFGLGQYTDVDLPSEWKGLMPSRAWKKQTGRGSWFPGQTLNVGIGQGYMLTTPMQLANMTAILARKGHRITPTVVSTKNGEPLENTQLEPIVLKKEKHWDIIIDSMEEVIYGSHGTARRLARNAKYRMGGKSGTAQVVGIAQGEKYDSEALQKRQRDHALFVAFAPLEDPQIAVAVIVENGESGSGVAGPVAKTVMDAFLLPQLEKAEEISAQNQTDSASLLAANQQAVH